MNILFVLYHDFSSNSAVHVHHFANGLIELGCDCIVAVPNRADTISILVEPHYQTLEFDQVAQISTKFSNGQGPDIVHCWTPREIVRQFCDSLRQLFTFELVIHLEDNEEHVTEKFMGQPFQQLQVQQEYLQVPPALSHPVYYRKFLESATGITVIIDQLKDFIPPAIPSLVLWPGADHTLFYPQTADAALLKKFKIEPNDWVICYTGNVHPVNAQEVRSLYIAIGLLNREGYPTKLIRTGRDFVDFLEGGKEWTAPYCIELGYVDRPELPKILSLAHTLVQPGKVNAFNQYRFPSKVPEFLAMGKPVILPDTNIGKDLKHLSEAVILPIVDAIHIVESIQLLRSKPELVNKIGQGAAAFAQSKLVWSIQSQMLKDFYGSLSERLRQSAKKIKNEVIMKPVHLLNETTKVQLIERYENCDRYKRSLDYATVRDFCDSVDHLPQVCFLNGDLKNVQRAWTVKAILSNVPIGSRLLEIGGGVPLVAGLLSELGYDVTLIDPYEGSGNGPTSEYQQYVTQFPHVKIVKDLFGSHIDYFEHKSFDAVYSISVIEHIPLAGISDVFEAILTFVKPGGASIHCIDDVVQGNGTEGHAEMVKHVLLNQKRLAKPAYADEQIESDFSNLMQALFEDLETFYLSPLGHNLWRGQMSYDEFPFRKVVSIQTCEFLP